MKFVAGLRKASIGLVAASIVSFLVGCGGGGGSSTAVMPSIVWATPAPITYGTPLGGFQLNAFVSVPGTLTYSPAAGTVLPAGVHALTATFNPTDTKTYTSA
ncbi:MAG TPA: hypothetical protein VGD64_04750, partial [Acidisarcina sp.]